VRIRPISDLHFETVRHPERFCLPDLDFDVLVVAGDVWRSRPDLAAMRVADLARDRPSVMVLGNHEPWGRSYAEVRAQAREACEREGVVLLDDRAVVIGGVRFVGGTLWTDGLLGGFAKEWPRGRTGEDIRVQGRVWTIADARKAHRETLSLIEAATAFDDGIPLVVVTHHPPLEACLSRSCLGKPISGIMGSDLSRVTDTGKIALWIHGHVHGSVDLVRPNGTRIFCNPAGNAFSNHRFDEARTVEVPSFDPASRNASPS
jgi:Icc-related predicted phosphoesterase